MGRIIAFILLITSLHLSAEEMVICPLIYYKSVKKTVEANGSFDKYKHCAVSCLLSIRCPAVDVLELGIFKELLDVAGPGNAEIADLKADYAGVALVTTGKAKTDKACLSACHKLYPENSCP